MGAKVNSYQQRHTSDICNWYFPTAIRLGMGVINDVAPLCCELQISRLFVVIDPFLLGQDMVMNIQRHCQVLAIHTVWFSQFQANPTEVDVAAGVMQYQQRQCNGVLAIGGGSALDTAKAIALMSGQEGHLFDYEDIGDNWLAVDSSAIAPLIAVPTTAGTGSEVGRAAVIVDSKQHCKRIIFHPLLLPRQVLLDPELTIGLPAALTATTGMDALAHNLEAYCVSDYHPMADGIALMAIQMIKTNLLLAYQQPTCLSAREAMLVAATMGACAFQKGLGAMHALAHALGGKYNCAHGLLNAVLMPYVLVANRQMIEDKVNHLARQLAVEPATFDGFMTWLLALRQQLQIPHTLAEIGISNINHQEIALLAVADATAATNPMVFSSQQYATLLANAIAGKLVACE